MRVRAPRFLIVTVFLIVATAQAQTQIKPGFNLFSPQDDVQIGQQSAAQADQQLPILNDPVINQYVNAIGQRLAANAGGPAFQYHFKVVNSSDINAFALPGGFVYINRGVIDNARNEGELAGVMAHEISHAALRHGTHQASKAYLAQAGIGILGSILGGRLGQNTTNIIGQLGGLGLNVLFLKYSRDIESQADIRGAQVLAASGYTPQDLINFFQTLERVDPAKKTNFLADHPAPPDRIARIQKEALLLHASSHPTENVAELHQMQARLGGTAVARSARVARSGPAAQPSLRGSSQRRTIVQVAAPSSQMNTFVSPSRLYSISYPANWQVYTSGNAAATFAPQGGAGTVNGQSEIVYGAVVNVYAPFNAAGPVSLQTATNDLIQQIRQGSPYLRVASSAQSLRLSGGNALASTLRGTDPNSGLAERVTVVTRAVAGDDLIYLLFITPERDAASYRPVLQSMIDSIRVAGPR